MKLENSFLENFVSNNPELFDGKLFKNGSGKKYRAIDLLDFIFSYYITVDDNNARTLWWDFQQQSGFFESFNSFADNKMRHYHKWGGGEDVGSQIWEELLESCARHINQNTLINKSLYCGIILEKFDNLYTAIESCNVSKLAPLIAKMPKDAFNDMLAEWALRTTMSTESLYNDFVDDVRISNHWNIGTANSIIGSNGAEIRNQWKFGKFSHEEQISNRTHKMYKILKDYPSERPTQEEIVRRYNLLIDLFVGSPQKQKQLERLRNVEYAKIPNKRRL